MKKTIVCIFAHPDDEAYGPSGTIAKLAKENDIYILCATKGDAGQDALQDEKTELGERRANELLASAKILGVKDVYFLGLKDGTLSNNLYHKIAEKIEEKLEELKPEILITFPPTGNSGHLDHVAISYISTYVFYKLNFIKELWQHILLEEKAKILRKDYFVYIPKGYEMKDVNKTVDVSGVWDVKVQAMRAHESQKSDTERMLHSSEGFPQEEYFLVIKR